MCVAATAKRRRRQFAMGLTHIAKLGRPIYHRKSKESQDRRRAEVIANERRIAQGKNKSKR